MSADRYTQLMVELEHGTVSTHIQRHSHQATRRVLDVFLTTISSNLTSVIIDLQLLYFLCNDHVYQGTCFFKWNANIGTVIMF